MRNNFMESLDHENMFNEYKEKFGSVSSIKAYKKGNYPNKNDEIALTQYPYIDGLFDGEPVYRAHGVDKKGNDYMIVWEVKENWEEIIEVGDEQMMVENWDEPDDIEKI